MSDLFDSSPLGASKSDAKGIALDALTERETEVLQLLAEGLSDKEIAERLVVSVGTIKWYNRQIYSKLFVNSRTQAIVRANELGLLEDESEAPPDIRGTIEHNIPAQISGLIGRDEEINEIIDLLSQTRLLTITGAGGTGKTRLAMEICQRLLNHYRNGVFVVSLAAINGYRSVIPAIAEVLHVAESGDQPLLDTLKASLRKKHRLILLDNFEHVIAAAPMISELLQAAPQLTIIITSREVLRVNGEQEYPLDPFDLPHLSAEESLNEGTFRAISRNDAVQLFMQRAQAVRPDFQLNLANIAAVVEICRRLDGLPLALELAAARVKLLTPQSIVSRLSSPLELLPGHARDVDARQQTLRGAIDWSYQLLNPAEKCLFARLGIFAGGANLAAIEEICDGEPVSDVLEGLGSLVDKSLLRVVNNDMPRFRMLGTIREFALEKLDESGESATIHERHARFFYQLALEAEPHLQSSGQRVWLDALEMEIGNIRLALEWFAEQEDAESGLRMCGALWWYWVLRVQSAEGLRWLDRMLEIDKPVSPAVRVLALNSGARLVYNASEPRRGLQMAEEALKLAQEIGDELQEAWALGFIALHRSAELGFSDAAVVDLIDQARQRYYAVGNLTGIGWIQTALGVIAMLEKDFDDSERELAKGLEAYAKAGNIWGQNLIRANLGLLAYLRGDYPGSKRILSEIIVDLRIQVDVITNAVAVVAYTAVMENDYHAAALLLSCTDSLCSSYGFQLGYPERVYFPVWLDIVEKQLDQVEFAELWAEGQIMSLEEIVEYVRQMNH